MGTQQHGPVRPAAVRSPGSATASVPAPRMDCPTSSLPGPLLAGVEGRSNGPGAPDLQILWRLAARGCIRDGGSCLKRQAAYNCLMLAFVDESGDSGRKPDKGSSAFFTMALVTFPEREEADACDRRIALLRHELRKPVGFEFKFRENSHEVRMRLLEAISPFGFFYHGLTVDKDPRRLHGPGRGDKESLQGFTCRLVFEAARPYLTDATVVIDETGGGTFMQDFKRYLRARARD